MRNKSKNSILTLLFFILYFFGGTSNLYAQKLTLRSDTLSIGIALSNAPFGYVWESKYTGIDVNIGKTIARELNLFAYFVNRNIFLMLIPVFIIVIIYLRKMKKI